jgi:hypothetical protein
LFAQSSSIAALLIYGLGIPVGFGLWLRHNQSLLTDPEFALRYGSLYASYRVKYPFWESLVMLEKAAIAMIGMILSGFVSLQLSMLGIVFTLTLVSYKGRDPFVRDEDNLLHRVLRWCSVVVLSAAHTFRASDFPNDTIKDVLVWVAIVCIIAGTVVVAVHVILDLIKVHRAQKVKLPAELVRLMGDVFSPQGIAVASRWFQLCSDSYRERWMIRVHEALTGVRATMAGDDRGDPGSATLDDDDDVGGMPYSERGRRGAARSSDNVRPISSNLPLGNDRVVSHPCTDNEHALIQTFSSDLWQARAVPSVRAWLFTERRSTDDGMKLRHGLLDWLAAVAGAETGSAVGEIRDPARASPIDRDTFDLLYGRFAPVERITASRIANDAWRCAVHDMTVAHVKSDGIPLHPVILAGDGRRKRRDSAAVQVDRGKQRAESHSALLSPPGLRPPLLAGRRLDPPYNGGSSEGFSSEDESDSFDSASLSEVVFTDSPFPVAPKTPASIRSPFGSESSSTASRAEGI